MRRSLLFCVVLVALSYAGVLIYMLPRIHLPISKLNNHATTSMVNAVPTLPELRSNFMRQQQQQKEKEKEDLIVYVRVCEL